MDAATNTFSIRPAESKDVPTILFHRRAMFEEMGFTDRNALDVMNERFADWVKIRIERREYLGWFVADDAGQILAGAGLWLEPNVATPRDQSPLRGHVLNVYTQPECRRQGLARRLMSIILDYCQQHQIRTVVLHASDAGRPLYESIGFRQTNEMRISLSDAT